MDIISHGLWGGISFGRKNKNDFIKSFLFGFGPDFFSFGLLTIASFIGLDTRPDFSGGLPDPSSIPQYVHTLYDITHSIFIFAVVLGIVWFIRKKPLVPMFAWGLHILMDIPTHSKEFFPTPFLWPFSDFKFDGVSWGNPVIFYPEIALLITLYILWFLKKKWDKKNS